MFRDYIGKIQAKDSFGCVIEPLKRGLIKKKIFFFLSVILNEN